MANVDSPFGLRPVQHLNGNPWNGKVNPYYIASGYGTALYVGDPVVRVAAGSNTARVSAPGAGSFEIGTCPNVEKATAGDGNPITGIIVGFAASPTNLALQYNPASTERIAYVCDDPTVLFEIQADGAIPAASIGLNGVLIYTHSGSTVTGLSGVELDTTSDAPDTTSTNQVKIVKAVNSFDNDTTLTHAKVLVQIINHTQAHATAGI